VRIASVTSLGVWAASANPGSLNDTSLIAADSIGPAGSAVARRDTENSHD
jgi:hypothetical protein